MKTSNPRTNYYGTKYWVNEDGNLHREDGLPAVEYKDGSKAWWNKDTLYRFDDWITWL